LEGSVLTHISIPVFLSVDPAASGFYDAYEVQGAYRFKLKEISIDFPSGTNGELELSLYHGRMKVAPRVRVWKGDDARIREAVEFEYGSKEVVRFYYENKSTTDVRKATIVLEGELV